jgi:multiple sugar transport system ATP-binding protein
VTHDQVEAMTLGQRVAVMRDGVLQQVDTPQRLFHRPKNLFVAAFIGSPSMNLVEAELADGRARFAGYELPLVPGSPLGSVERNVILGIRPTDFEHAATAEPGLPRLRVRADVVEELGAETHLIFTIDAPRVSTDAVRAAAEATEDDAGKLLADDRAVLTASVDGKRHVPVGAEIELAVDHRALHFFDPDTGLALDAGARVHAAA